MHNRAETIRKLGNAIREYRGTREGKDGPWKRSPNLTRAHRERMEGYLARLDLPIESSLCAISSFVSFDEMRAWMKKVIQTPGACLAMSRNTGVDLANGKDSTVSYVPKEYQQMLGRMVINKKETT